MTPEIAFTMLVAGGLIGHLGEHALEHGQVLGAYGLGLFGITLCLLAIGALLYHAATG